MVCRAVRERLVERKIRFSKQHSNEFDIVSLDVNRLTRLTRYGMNCTQTQFVDVESLLRASHAGLIFVVVQHSGDQILIMFAARRLDTTTCLVRHALTDPCPRRGFSLKL